MVNVYYPNTISSFVASVLAPIGAWGGIELSLILIEFKNKKYILYRPTLFLHSFIPIFLSDNNWILWTTYLYYSYHCRWDLDHLMKTNSNCISIFVDVTLLDHLMKTNSKCMYLCFVKTTYRRLGPKIGRNWMFCH